MKPVTIDQANQSDSDIVQPIKKGRGEIEAHWYCKLLSSLPLPGFICEMAEAKILYANPQFAEVVGLTPEQVMGYPVKGFSVEAREWDVLMMTLSTQQSLPHAELRWQKADGLVFSGRISLQLVPTENETLILGIFHEIFPHQHLEQALQDHQRLPSTLMNNFPGMVYRCRLEGNQTWMIDFASEGCLRLTGYSVSDLIQNGTIYEEIRHPQDRDRVYKTILSALNQQESFQVEYRILTKTGKQKWVWEQGQGLFSETGKLIGVEGFITDITERKRAEEEVCLLQTLTQIISESPDFESALAVTLRQVCEATCWDYGEAWIPNEAGTVLRCSPAWYGSCSNRHSVFERLHSQSLQYEFPPLVGMPGEVWLSRQPKWLPDVSRESDFVRADLAKSFGLKAGFGVPILANDQVVAVLVFFMFESCPEDERLVKLISTVAAQLGGVIQRKQAEAALQESQRQLASLINAIPGIFFSAANENGWSMCYISEGCQELTGYSRQELIGNRACSFDTITHSEDLPQVLEAIASSIAQQRPYVVEYRICTKWGEEKWVWEKGHGVYDQAGNIVALEGFISDITQHKLTEAELRQTEANYRGIVENAIEGIFQTTPDGHYINANPALARIYGYDSPQELIASLTDIEHQLYVNPQRRTEFIELLQENDFVSEFESQVYRRDGSVIWISEKARAVRNAYGTLLYYEGMVEEITERKRAKDKLTRRAFYDPLTGLSNRAMFMERLGQALSRCQRSLTQEHCHRPCQFALLFLDLDRFKVVNDSLGHLVGDELLIAIARRLERCVRDQDLVARLGGDEFTILLEDVPSIDQAIAIAERIKQELNEPFSLRGHQVFTGTSIGIVLSCGQSDDAPSCTTYSCVEDLLRDADTALYRAKAAGKGCVKVFDPTMHDTAVALLEWETELRQALQRQEFAVHYQPIICLNTGKLFGFEALLRWQHPLKGLISPEQFLSIAQETGLILPLGHWMLERVCQQIQEWLSSQFLAPLLESETFFVQINLCNTQLMQPDLLETVDRILHQTGIDGYHLMLAISENGWLENVALAKARLAKLREYSIQLCIDDFGIGYSSLGALHQFPIDALKIDRAFIRSLDSTHEEITRTIITLAESLGIKAIAEGIENEEQLVLLQKMGCHFGQGNFWGNAIAQDSGLTPGELANRINLPQGRRIGKAETD